MSVRSLLLAAALLAGVAAKDTGASSDDPCMADKDNTFHLEWDMYASTTGYFKIKECGNTIMPTIGMKKNVVYTFDQTNIQNWYHAVGFAYYPDGAHADVDELEPSISQTEGDKCVDDHTCQAPMYYVNGEYVGTSYDNTKTPIEGGDDFGLDVYEPQFFNPEGDWAENEYTATLILTDMVYDKDLFYFCHIHNKMSARIKMLDDDGKVIHPNKDRPELGYEYQVPSDFDAECGTYGIGDYTMESGQCDGPFICHSGDETEAVKKFGECLYAMDCAMEKGMQSFLNDENPVVTFSHQMIPHHANAVNMAKALLKINEDNDMMYLDPEDEGDAEMISLCHDIINTQNFQINAMQGYLAGGDYPADDSCSPADSTWHATNSKGKDCDWARKHKTSPNPRCSTKGVTGDGEKMTAGEACHDMDC